MEVSPVTVSSEKPNTPSYSNFSGSILYFEYRESILSGVTTKVSGDPNSVILQLSASKKAHHGEEKTIP